VKYVRLLLFQRGLTTFKSIIGDIQMLVSINSVLGLCWMIQFYGKKMFILIWIHGNLWMLTQKFQRESMLLDYGYGQTYPLLMGHGIIGLGGMT